MGLADTVKNLVDTALITVGDLAESITYRRRTAGTYNAATGVVTPTTSDTTSVKALLTDYSHYERQDLSIQPNDQKAYIGGNSLSFTPGVGDILVRSDSTLWDIVSIKTYPGSPLWELQVRQRQ